MEQAFRVEITDYLQLNNYLVNRNPRMKLMRVVYRFGVPLFLCAGLYAYGMLPLVVLIPIVVCFFGLFFFASKSQLKQIFTRSYRMDTTGVCVIEVTPAEFRFRNPEYEIRAKWEKITGIALTPTHLVFMLLTLRSFVIPRSAFADDEHARAFLETALAYQAGTLSEEVSAPETTAWPPPPQRMDRSNRAG